MIKKLTKFGNSHALIIDKPIMELLHITENSELQLTVEGDTLIIHRKEKVKKTLSNKNLQELIEKNIKKYAPALKKLSKN